MHNLRVISLQAQNLLRLSAVAFDWTADNPVLTLGGKNGAGKSSVLNTVSMALGGMALCPDEPLKRGESRGFVEMDLDELVVRREFWRDLLTEQPPAPAPPAYGEVKSRLVVKNKEGVKQEPAQRLLDRLIGKLTFDPTAFAFDDEKNQAKTLRQIVNLDVTAFDEARSIAYERRAVYNKDATTQLAVLGAMIAYEGTPAEEISLDEVSHAMKQAEELRKLASEADKQVSGLVQQRERIAIQRDSIVARVNSIDEQITALKKKRDEADIEDEGLQRVSGNMLTQLDAARIAAAAAAAAIPDTATLQARMHEIEDINSKVRANIARANVMRTVATAQKNAEEQDQLVNKADADKAAALRAVKFPIDGLGIAHDGSVTFNGIAFKQASTAEQIRVSVAIGFALNPELKLLCVKNGNALDEDSFKLVAAAAEAAGGQVLMEYVTKDQTDVNVFIEDGHTV